ncbi:glucose-6-phosphate isomerase [Alkalibacter saccharofermentans]|uniref:Glucose-6-phosphate isomerase n=1 Tax=Alkalibacter saccharofermentans DSM 14828 TaxID=1120975 RepID=A0A1M4U5N2_9FIRM|nr:glucose-6-phosphate isomerase [Alkalibacter saccharofermentans]SHE51998.1 glucose-6-phosphate isomerase [Alkalibacter saccharofermentans DSM 14828]
MKSITIDYSYLKSFISGEDVNNEIKDNRKVIEDIIKGKADNENVLGWIDVDKHAGEELIQRIEKTAKNIRETSDAFLLIGVGGSNQGARAAIKAFDKEQKPEIIYTGNTLSPIYMNKVLKDIEEKSVYANIIAKNFATLEPGISFRMIRNKMESMYGRDDAAKRIIATGSPNGSSLENLSNEKGYEFYDFPEDIGGRYSVITAVGLLPMAVAGIDIREVVRGAKDMAKSIKTLPLEENPAVVYPAIRNILYKKGYSVEVLAHFEPLFEYFTKWWVQLFGESEGKDNKGIFPAACSFSEDLHSLGQYIQDGKKNLFETFLNLEDQMESCPISEDESTIDYFDYLDGKDFSELNKVAFDATIKAHSEGGIPAMVFNIPKLTPYYFGQLFYLFEYSCYISGVLLGVNPFDQPGVEAYKNEMFASLKKEKEEIAV